METRNLIELMPEFLPDVCSQLADYIVKQVFKHPPFVLSRVNEVSKPNGLLDINKDRYPKFARDRNFLKKYIISLAQDLIDENYEEGKFSEIARDELNNRKNVIADMVFNKLQQGLGTTM